MTPTRRPTLGPVAIAMVATAVLGLLFTVSYVGALHQPRPHDIPVAVAGSQGLASNVDSSRALAATYVADAAAARRLIDRGEVYGAVIREQKRTTLVLAPAAGVAIAQLLRAAAPQLQKATGDPVRIAVVHPLPRADARGLVGAYTVVGWVVAGWFAATLLGLLVMTRRAPSRGMSDLLAISGLAVVVGVGGAAIAHGVGHVGGSFVLLALIGVITTLAVGATTLVLQARLGLAGAGLAVVLFIVVGNPSAGGPFEPELLPSFWRSIGIWLPPGAATRDFRDVAYFPDAPLGTAFFVLLAWAAAGAALAVLLSRRATEVEQAAAPEARRHKTKRAAAA